MNNLNEELILNPPLPTMPETDILYYQTYIAVVHYSQF